LFRVKLLPSVIVVSVMLSAGAASFSQSLSDIRNSIRARNQKWIAEDTSISILPDQERRRRLGLIKPMMTGAERMLAEPEALGNPPPSVDWTTFVTPARNQGSCGSCWAFATTAALESNLLIRGNLPLTEDDRAEQILLSCSGAGNCEQGGSIGAASSYIQSTGLPTEPYFPYTATNNSCSNARAGWMNDAGNIGSWSYVNTTSVNLETIKNALSTNGPLVSSMDVYGDFYSYRGGIYEFSSGSYQGGHAILIVGYTDDATRADGGYFKVKNSWGASWGNNGFFLIGYSQIGDPVHFGEWTIAYTAPNLPSLPAAPGGLAANVVSGSQINLSWTDNASNEDGTKIERCSGTGCSNFSQIATVGAGVNIYRNGGLAADTTYSYRVRAYNSGGNSNYSNITIASTSAPLPPSPPTSLHLPR
jgi:C1A family cysteine protease